MSGTCVVKKGRKFYVVVYLGPDPKTGKRRSKWYSGFETRKEAEVFQATMAHHPAFSAGMGVYGSTRIRTGDYLDDWLKQHRTVKPLEEKTAERYEQFIKVHLKLALGHIPIYKVSPRMVSECYRKLLEKKLSRTTAHHIAVLLRQALDEAVRQGVISQNPAAQTDPPSRDTKPRTAPTAEQLRAFIEDSRETAPLYLWALYLTKACTGMRLGELLGLRESDIDFDKGTLAVMQTLKKAGAKATFGNPKTDRSRRTITLPAEVLDALRQLRKWKREQKLRLGPRYKDYGLVFCGPTGRTLQPQNIRNRDFLPRLERLKLPRIRLHDLRHAHGTYLVSLGFDARTVADRLGHASPAFTMQTYVHGVSEAQRRAAEASSTFLVQSAAKSG